MEGSRLFAIRCEEEDLVLSNPMESNAWAAIERLISLLQSENQSSLNGLFAWKERRHLATAKEVYSWRGAIEVIKDADLNREWAGSKGDPSLPSLMRSKPIMLRLTGEITNALLHSYNLKHRITFFQCHSTEPS
jgi:hypothetical protein